MISSSISHTQPKAPKSKAPKPKAPTPNHPTLPHPPTMSYVPVPNSSIEEARAHPYMRELRARCENVRQVTDLIDCPEFLDDYMNDPEGGHAGHVFVAFHFGQPEVVLMNLAFKLTDNPLHRFGSGPAEREEIDEIFYTYTEEDREERRIPPELIDRYVDACIEVEMREEREIEIKREIEEMRIPKRAFWIPVFQDLIRLDRQDVILALFQLHRQSFSRLFPSPEVEDFFTILVAPEMPPM